MYSIESTNCWLAYIHRKSCLLHKKEPLGSRGEGPLIEVDLPRRRRAGTTENVESPGGLSPPGAPRSVREPLDSHGSRCSAVSMTQLPVGEERWVCAAKPIKPISRALGPTTQPLELAARPADDIEIDPLQGRTQLRPIEVAVVADPASNVRVVRLGQILQGFVAVMMKRPSPDRPAYGRQRL